MQTFQERKILKTVSSFEIAKGLKDIFVKNCQVFTYSIKIYSFHLHFPQFQFSFQ